MKKMFRKPLCVILTVCLLVGMIPTFSLSASAAVAEVSDMDTFKELMEQDGDVSIKLTDDISKDIFGGYDDYGHGLPVPYFITVGKGEKIIDLNGNDINASLDDFHQSSTMFKIDEGASVVVNDSSGKNSGEIFYNGYIPAYQEEYRIITMNMDAPNQNRDIFEVNGGSLTINGGQITAGRQKEETSWGTEYNKILNGTPVELNSGRVVINGGILTARGMHKVLLFPRFTSAEWDDALAQGKIKAFGILPLIATRSSKPTAAP